MSICEVRLFQRGQFGFFFQVLLHLITRLKQKRSTDSFLILSADDIKVIHNIGNIHKIIIIIDIFSFVKKNTIPVIHGGSVVDGPRFKCVFFFSIY